MDIEALIASTMKRRIAESLGVRFTWKEDGRTFTRYYATIADRDAAIKRQTERGHDCEIISA
jgi:hypothetical protein